MPPVNAYRGQHRGGREPFPIPLAWYLLLTTALTAALAFEWWMSLRSPWQTPQPFLKLLFICATTNFLWAGIAFAAWQVVLRFPVLRPHVARDLAAHCGMVLLVLAAHCLRYETVTWTNSLPGAFHYVDFISIVDYFFRAEAITYATIYVAVAWLLRATWLVRKADRDALQAARLQGELDRAKLQILQGQLEPHFLFNALNCVSSLMRKDPDEADLMLERIAGLLRKSLEMGNAERVRLSEELAFCREYLEVQRERFRDRLAFALEVAPDLLAFPVPALILQPLVENAVIHGVARSGQQARIVIAASQHNDTLLISVRNNVMDENTSLQAGVGLANIRNRLELLYRSAGKLTITRSLEEFTAELTIPLHTRFDENAGESLPASGDHVAALR